ncbi:BgtAc-31498, partial [Blumeria graminis f. sp. tritici]
MRQRPTDYKPSIHDPNESEITSKYKEEEISPELPSLNQKDDETNPFVNSLVQNDAQSEDEQIVIPENLMFLKEAFSKEGAAQLPPLQEGTDMTIYIPDAGFVDVKYEPQQTYFLSKNFIPKN